MTGQEFLNQYAPIRDVEIQKCHWLFGNQAVFCYGHRTILQVSPAVYECIIDPDMTFETWLSLEIDCVRLVRLTDQLYTLRE